MKLALFIGSHAKDTFLVRLGWWLTRLVQKGQYWRVTHVEAILAENSDGTVTIASCSLREGGVRVKENVMLVPENWIIVDTPFDEHQAKVWFALHLGQKYDLLGAFASCVPIQLKTANRWFCNEAVGAACGVQDPEVFGPSQFASFMLTIGQNVTTTFFGER